MRATPTCAPCPVVNLIISDTESFFPPMSSRRVFVVSFPRSGHHLLAGLIGEVKGDSFSYCEYYNCLDHKFQPVACEAADWPHHFRTVCRSGRRFQKNHDFDLALPVDDSFLYVVLLRHPVFSLTSWWVHTQKHGSKEDREIPLRDFVLGRAAYWRGFAAKWSLDTRNRENVLSIRYEDLTRDVDVFRSVLRFCGEADTVRDNFLDERINAGRELGREAHFDAGLYRELQEVIGFDFLRELGYDELRFDAQAEQ